MNKKELYKKIGELYNELYDLVIDERHTYGEETKKLLHKAINQLSDARMPLLNEMYD